MKAATLPISTTNIGSSFQSTPPVKAATFEDARLAFANFISIHAAREGGDVGGSRHKVWDAYISIHAAREGGDFSCLFVCTVRNRISIHAAREGGDKIKAQAYMPFAISIHAAREGGD